MADRAVLSFKLVVLGDTSVGKSCLSVRWVRGEFFDYQEPTIGAAFLTQTVSLEDCTVRFELWDTAGQERYRSLAPMYYRGAAAAVVVFDVTNRDTFDGAKSWVKELQRRGDPNVVIALAGNKADMRDRRQVEAEEASAYATANGILYLDTSAKTGLGVKDLFAGIAKRLPRSAKPAAPDSGTVDLSEPAKKKGGDGEGSGGSGGGCCK